MADLNLDTPMPGIGQVQWHGSDEDGGPDVGILIGLSADHHLWLGERSNSEGGGMGMLVYGPTSILATASLSEYDELREVVEQYVAPALAGYERDAGFIAEIHDRTPTGAWIAVQHHPNGDWSVAERPLPWLPGGQIVASAEVDALIAWARDNQAFPEGNSGGEGRGHIDENARFKLRDMITAIDAAEPASLPCKSGEGAGEIDQLAQFLHDEGGFGDAMTDRTWPEHDGDTGQRGDGWVKIVPSDVVAKFRDVARRWLLPRAALTPDATQTREAELVAACEAYVEAYDAGTGTIHVNKQIRAALNARGGA